MATHPEKIGKYEIQGALGKGAMGTVYKAFDRAIARSVAIKSITKARLAPGELKHVLNRFRHEAQAVGRINHPRIVQIYDYGEDDEIAYIVMEIVNGKTLAQHLSQEMHYDVREAGEIIRQILDGIGYAHTQGVVHRDMKPSNIMINDDGRIKISDFGIAHIEASELTQVGDVLGTPHYMAPEQFLGAEVDAVADLYSVGVLAYELLTGRKPFMGNTAAVMQMVLSQPPPNPSQLNSKLSLLIDRVLQKALAKKREERFQNAREFSDGLREAVEATLGLDAIAQPIAPDSEALLDAARLLNLGLAKVPPAVDNVTAVLAGDSMISIDTGVRQVRLLFIDDEERILTALKSLFKARYHVFATVDPEKALDFMGKHQMHVIISDQRMPQIQGVELLRRSREISPNSVRILLTGYADLTAIVGSINDGEVYRFISKPWDNQELHTTIAEAATIARELTNARTPAVTLPKKMEAGLLVIDKDESIARVVRELIGGRCPVVFAAGLDDALAAMQNHDIAVVVVDVENASQLTTLLKLLKQENPRILAIVVTTASDSELVIDLINQAQIFRFLNKPVNVKLLKNHLESALQRYLTYQQAPELSVMHHVEAAEEMRSSTLGQRILSTIKSLRW